jgi:CBS domain-containing protein
MPLTAVDIMTSPAIVASVETTMSQIAAILATRGISAVPICGPDRTLLGIVSEADILRPLRNAARMRREWWVGEVTEGEGQPRDFLEYLRDDHRKAGEVMVRHVIAAEEDMPIPVLADLMVKHGVKRMPVVRDGRVVGIISRSDLVAAIARGNEAPPAP